MIRHPPVSVILPVYNREHSVRRAIDSVLAQTMADFELIVVDDCSTDRSVEVVQAYDDPRIRLHRNPRNMGAAGARNSGIQQAGGTYVAFQDSDDRWFPEKLEMQLAALKASPGARVCYCGALYFAPEQCYYIPRQGTIDRYEGDLVEEILYSNPTTPQTLMIERTLFDATGVFNDNLRINEDWDLAIRIAQQAEFVFVPDPLAVIYRTAGSVSSDQRADTAFREGILHDYAALYAGHPVARGRQHYIIGSQKLNSRAYRDAARHFKGAFRDSPSLRGLVQMLRAQALSLISAGNRRG